jgi:hypothetical protein
MIAHTLGRLTHVDLREIWTSEASDFTPWLAREENLTVLAETLGIDLELEAQEKAVGPFRAGILCKDIGSLRQARDGRPADDARACSLNSLGIEFVGRPEELGLSLSRHQSPR